jgi:amino acid adenylation domain-containing protein
MKEHLAQQTAHLSPEQQAILREKLRTNYDESDAYSDITAANISHNVLLKNRSNTTQIDSPTNPKTAIIPRLGDQPAPLSFAQQRLWVIDQIQPHSAVYNICWTIRLAGELNIPALQQSLNAIVARHESLRTTYAQLSSPSLSSPSLSSPSTTEPIQVVHPVKTVDLTIQSVTTAADEEMWLQTVAQQPFSLSQDCMLRATLVQRSTTEAVLLLVLHHIAGDGWSKTILNQELAAYYRAFVTATPPDLPELPIQYKDYAHWQRQWLTGPRLTQQVDYWTQKLQAAPPYLELPTDYPRPAALSLHGQSQRFRLSEDLTNGLRQLSKRSGATLYMTLLAAFNVLLYRYTQQTDVLVGSPIGNRKQLETENLIGFLVNTIVLRNDLSGNPSFRELLQRVRRGAREAYAHQDVPFEKLVEVLQPERRLGHTPLAQVFLVLQNLPSAVLEMPGLVATPQPFEIPIAKFDLTLQLREGPALAGHIEYSTDLFTQPTIERFIGHFQMLLQAIVADPDQRIEALPLMGEVEQQHLLSGWNQTQVPIAQDCIHQVFERQAALTPDAIAVQLDQDCLSYRELNQQANQLAHHLRSLGVNPASVVGVYLERTPQMMVAFLAILKAGGAYLPLDPTYPTDRIAFMLADAATPVVVTTRAMQLELPVTQARMVYCDAPDRAIAQAPIDNLENWNTREHLAYVIYTSGSTGKPKGVMVPHRGVTRLVLNTRYVKFQPGDVMAQVSNCAFDAATFEIWGAFLNGHKLAIIPKEVLLSPTQFALAIREQSLSVMFLTVALFNQLVQTDANIFATMRYVLFGGDAADPSCVRRSLNASPPQYLVNAYGPTENTTFSITYTAATVSPTATNLPIGQPIENSQAFILDAHLQPLPQGVTGELYLGGDGVALGYLNRPELTAERFIPVPHDLAAQARGRLYKTGDLARYLPDGNIEFLGRIDHQVKIRGFRIELGEIEYYLMQHPDIQQAIVIVREDQPGNKQLVGYVIANPETVNSATLRSYLQQSLPDYMVPMAVVVLASLPLTPNGKVDRQALPVPTPMATSDRPLALPQDEVELQILNLWKAILNTEAIGVEDNFFDLGGHSLMALRLFSQIERRFGQTLPLSVIFQAPTVKLLAATLRQRSIQVAAVVQFCQGDGQRTPLFFLPGASNNLLYAARIARTMSPAQPIYGLSEWGETAQPYQPGAIEQIAAHYIAEIRQVQPHGPYQLIGYSFGGIVAYEIAQQLHHQNQVVDFLGLIDPTHPAPRHWLRRGLQPLRTMRGMHRVLRWVQGSDRWLIRNRQRGFDQNIQRWIDQGKRVIGLPVAAMVDIPTITYGSTTLESDIISGGEIAGISANFDYERSTVEYLPQTYAGHIHFLLSEENRIHADRWSNWSGLAQGGFEILPIPGEHDELYSEATCRTIAGQVQSYLPSLNRSHKAISPAHKN